MEQETNKENSIEKPLPKLSEEDRLNQFFTLVFMTNPMTHYIKVWITSEDMELYFRQDRFINLLCNILGEDMRNILNNACMEYGGFYFLDRKKKELKTLSLSSVDQRLTPKELLKKVHENKKNQPYYDELNSKFGKAYQNLIKLHKKEKDCKAIEKYIGF